MLLFGITLVNGSGTFPGTLFISVDEHGDYHLDSQW